jgi:ribosomal protein S18 acetylase RimI-like enzyme
MARVRRTEQRDLDHLGEIHVRSWQAAYRGLLPDAYLDTMDVAESRARWHALFTPGGGALPIQLVAVDDDDDAVGFVSAGAAPAEDEPGVGQVYGIYLRPDAFGLGHGRALLGAAEQALAALGFDEAVLWVMPGNARARRFYELAGWTCDGVTKHETIRGADVDEIRYRRSLSPGGPASPASA